MEKEDICPKCQKELFTIGTKEVYCTGKDCFFHFPLEAWWHYVEEN